MVNYTGLLKAKATAQAVDSAARLATDPEVAVATKAATRCRSSYAQLFIVFSVVNNILYKKTPKNVFLSPLMLVMSGRVWLIKRRRRRPHRTVLYYTLVQSALGFGENYIYITYGIRKYSNIYLTLSTA
jgi:hypothetical protein